MKILKLNLVMLSLLITAIAWGQNVSLPAGSANPNNAGQNNVALGGESLSGLAGGIWNVGIGQNTGKSTIGTGFPNLTGSFNTFIGGNAGRDNVSGIRNMYLGLNAGRSSNGSDNIFIGTRCGEEIGSTSLGVPDVSNTLLIGTSLRLDAPLIYGEMVNNQVGIGTSQVGGYRLAVGGSLGVRSEAPDENTYLDLNASKTQDWASQIRFFGTNGLRHVIVDDQDNNRLMIRPGFDDNTGALSILHINGSTLVGNGSVSTPEGYKLYVTEGILTEKLKIADASGIDWADYVFEEDYDRNTTDEVEAFIKANKHLPNVPSAKEVSENGIDVAEMDATLLRQIEELWLHVIELKKENEALKAEMTELKK